MTRRDLFVVIATSIATTFATASLFLGARAIADGKPSTDGVPRYIPYKGTLEKDGEPVSGSLSMTFSLFDGASDTTADWTETQTVTVYAGQFSAMLGSSSTTAAATLDAVVANADDLYLSVSLVSEGKTITLQNKQRFLPVPFAMWAPSSTNLVVEGDDNTGATAALIVRDPSANNLYIDGNEIESSGTLAINKVGGKTVQFGGGTEFTGWPTFYGTDLLMKSSTTTDGGRALVRSGDNLVINYAGDFGLVQVQGTELKHNGYLSADDGTVDFKANAYVPGVFGVGGQTNLGGNLAVSGTSTLTGDVTVGGKLSLGYEFKTCTAQAWCECSSGTRVVTGGGYCSTSGASIITSQPLAGMTAFWVNDVWYLVCSSGSPNTTVVCARIQ